MTSPNSNRPDSTRLLRIGIIGSGPAGVYAADLLTKADTDYRVSIDVIDRLPTPFGLIRYGVAPDHPRIKGIVSALHRVMHKDEIRFLGNVDYGTGITLDALREFYDAIIFATGCIDDAGLDIPGIDLAGSYGAAEFVNWYDGHPDFPRDWPLDAREVAVIGNGNVALDVARMLAKHADDLLPTEIPHHVYEGLKSSAVTDVHVFGRRGPAQVKFTPLELRELGKVPDVDIVLYPEDIQFDDESMRQIHSNNQTKQVTKTLTDWTLREPGSASRRLHLHFLQSPARVLGDSHVTGLRTERMELDGSAGVRGTGEFTDWSVGAVYRAVGYFGTPIKDVPFDDAAGVITNDAGRVVDDGVRIPGLYTTGWIKRGPVGLIGHTKGDALETVTNLLADADGLAAPARPEPRDVDDYLTAAGIAYTTWDGWLALDAHERGLGEAFSSPRERIKVVPREEMVALARR